MAKEYKQVDLVTESTKKTHGGKRENAGRKKSAHKGETKVIRVGVELIPAIEQLKNGVTLSHTDVKPLVLQAEIESLKAENEKNKLELKETNQHVMRLIKDKKQLETDVSNRKLAHESSIKKHRQEIKTLQSKILKQPEPSEVEKTAEINPAISNVAIPEVLVLKPAKVSPVILHGTAGTTAKNAKVTLVLNPASIPRIDSTGQKQTKLKISVESMTFEADLNSKSYRKAIAAIDELGAENCAAILQGSMKEQGKLEGVGLVIQAKKAKEESSELSDNH